MKNIIENPVLKRIMLIKEREGFLNTKSFCQKLGVSNETLNTLIKRDTTPKVDFLLKIDCSFERYSLDWLLTGRGSMFKAGAVPKKEEKEEGYYSLYYYTSAETLLKILGDAPAPRIRYSSFNDTNDPKERTLFSRHYVYTEELLGGSFLFRGEKKIRDNKEARELFEQDCKFISFCKQPASAYHVNERVTLPRMWSQYGTERNKGGGTHMNGACIELDFEKMVLKTESNENGIKGLSFFDIEYKSNDEYCLMYYKNEIKLEEDVRFKYKDWSEEHEFRALLYNDSTKMSAKDRMQMREKDSFLDIEGCIKRIYLGADFRHENVVKLCNIIAAKRYEDVDPSTFTRIVISESTGLLENDNNGGMIISDMLEIIARDYPEYYRSLPKEYKSDYNIKSRDFEKRLAGEKKKDEENIKLNVEYWRAEYISVIREKDKLWKEKDEQNKQHIDAIDKIIKLKDDIKSLEEENLREKKPGIVEEISDMMDVLRKTGTYK
jgi:hypothetical protein